jgi:hypothetical protein
MGRYSEKVNTSPKQKKIKKVLEELGHTDVEVWWEPIGGATEMCGNEGGYFFSSEENTLEPIGYSFNEVMEYIQSASYFKIN